MIKETKSPENQNTPNFHLRRTVALGVAALALFVGIEAYNDATDSPKYSDKKIEWVAGPNQGLNVAAAQIKGAEDFDVREIVPDIEKMPENEVAMSDGVVQIGETIVVPESVTH